jgi:hypothetical protein
LDHRPLQMPSLRLLYACYSSVTARIFGGKLSFR